MASAIPIVLIAFSLLITQEWNWLLGSLNAKSISLKFPNHPLSFFSSSPSPFPFLKKEEEEKVDGTTPSVLLDLLLISLLLFSFHILFILERNGEMRRRNRFDSSLILLLFPLLFFLWRTGDEGKSAFRLFSFLTSPFWKWRGSSDCFCLIFSHLFLLGKEIIFSLFSSLLPPSSGMGKGIEREGKPVLFPF